MSTTRKQVNMSATRKQVKDRLVERGLWPAIERCAKVHCITTTELLWSLRKPCPALRAVMWKGLVEKYGWSMYSVAKTFGRDPTTVRSALKSYFPEGLKPSAIDWYGEQDHG